MSGRERDHLASRLRLKRAAARGRQSKEFNLARFIGAGNDCTLDFSKAGSPPGTLGEALNETIRLTPLHRKLCKLAGSQDAADCLRELAVKRGCLHYQNSFKSPNFLPETIASITDEELAIGLLHCGFERSALNIRIGAQMLSDETNDVDIIIRLAKREQCQTVVRYIAECGNRIEPNNPTWDVILHKLVAAKEAPVGILPHWSRFVSMTGLTQDGGPSVTWLRPAMTNRHQMIDQRSLFMHREMAEMIRQKPELYNHAKETLARWISNMKPWVPTALGEWQTILDTKTVEEVLDLICRDDENSQRLRQSSPFCILPQKRRADIFKRFEKLA